LIPFLPSAAAFPQLFAIAKGHLDEVGEETAERGIAVMRATWSVAWAVGPALGALGSAATLFWNTANAGSMFAGLAAGGWAQVFGYPSMFLACAGISGLGY
jgi:hypothetical protein